MECQQGLFHVALYRPSCVCVARIPTLTSKGNTSSRLCHWGSSLGEIIRFISILLSIFMLSCPCIHAVMKMNIAKSHKLFSRIFPYSFPILFFAPLPRQRTTVLHPLDYQVSRRAMEEFCGENPHWDHSMDSQLGGHPKNSHTTGGFSPKGWIGTFHSY